MLFFNYKLVIILGLSVVLYFIYREVDSLHYRLESVENRLNALDYNQSDKHCDIIYNVDTKKDKRSVVQEMNTSNDDINYDHTTKFNVDSQLGGNLFKNNTKQIIIDFNKSHNLNDPMFQVFTMQKANDYVEIYSNDNSEKNVTTLSVNSHNVSPKTPSPKIANPQTASPKTASPQSPSLKTASPKTASPQSPSLKTASPQSPSLKTASPKTASPQSPSLKTASPKNDNSQNTSIQVFDAQSKVNYKTLSMSDLSKIALENNIELVKVVDGKSKKKVKQELVNEIISKKNI